ncbi:unnamed protein product [Linum trigynum]|uniref:Uncharacterized protein n=1 Tax=Linum trigynum TaxID=586398 RepID=A0AAV2DCH0_9ROSI
MTAGQAEPGTVAMEVGMRLLVDDAATPTDKKEAASTDEEEVATKDGGEPPRASPDREMKAKSDEEPPRASPEKTMDRRLEWRTSTAFPVAASTKEDDVFLLSPTLNRPHKNLPSRAGSSRLDLFRAKWSNRTGRIFKRELGHSYIACLGYL